MTIPAIRLLARSLKFPPQTSCCTYLKLSMLAGSPMRAELGVQKWHTIYTYRRSYHLHFRHVLAVNHKPAIQPDHTSTRIFCMLQMLLICISNGNVTRTKSRIRFEMLYLAGEEAFRGSTPFIEYDWSLLMWENWIMICEDNYVGGK